MDEASEVKEAGQQAEEEVQGHRDHLLGQEAVQGGPRLQPPEQQGGCEGWDNTPSYLQD